MSIFEIDIDSEDTLLKAFDILHDATCDEDDIKYDAEKGILDIIFNRKFFEDSSKIKSHRILWVFHKHEYPIVKSHLHLEGLNFCTMHSKDKSLKTHTFNECKIKQNKCFLYFCEVLDMEIGFESSISGYLKDSEFIEGKKVSFIGFTKTILFGYRKS